METQNNIISLKNVNKIYPNGAQAVFDFNLDIKDGEFIVMAGPSGCGKSTTPGMSSGCISAASKSERTQRRSTSDTTLHLYLLCYYTITVMEK